jgi:hypothetical protein
MEWDVDFSFLAQSGHNDPIARTDRRPNISEVDPGINERCSLRH